MNIKTEQIHNGWKCFHITNDHGMRVSILNYGGIIKEMLVPDKWGKLENVVLGYQNIEDYQRNSHFLGAIIGRVAGRIQDASFKLNGNTYFLDTNDGENCLHSGSGGLHSVIWNADPFKAADKAGVKLTYTSPDNKGGFPGNVDIAVTYSLNNDNKLMINYEAISDKTTAFTLTNHSYFNLSGNLKDTIKQHLVKINSSYFAELHQNLIPTGNILDVSNTPFDFRYGQELSTGIESGLEQNTIAGNGYDHYFLFDQNQGNIIVKESSSGRVMEIETNQPGMIMYTASNLEKGLTLKEGLSQKYAGVCFETQGSPASLHHENFPSIVLKANTLYSKQTSFTFGAE
ncbi:aldose 1-epimerase [Lentibacillus halodurans]|uniref:Aldose 1-epimerase n=1 Tax=Lentibacillus halodurans TaxID=237679 RepID=A0A1I0XK42_9BACI|nr:aldose epimerase family protein [Lentibacillus halodurans]SFB00690.1 aldose 1-epimerase [Lentibacillus halodurans]